MRLLSTGIVISDDDDELSFKLFLNLKHLPGMQETQVRSLGREDPLEK